jgi:nitrite reductase/ring-hydroxylating ferredoxin subunit
VSDPSDPVSDSGIPARALGTIAVADVQEGQVNVALLASGRKALVLRTGQDITVFAEVCPHMGADMSEATYCADEGTLRCHWHGYAFDARDGHFVENPNVAIMAKLRAPSEHFDPERVPPYRLKLLPFRIEDGIVHIGSDGHIGNDLLQLGGDTA